MTGSTPVLIVIAGPGRGRSVAIDRALTIGRDEHAEMSIADLALSRRHCEIAPVDRDFVLRDLGSLNGSFVNDRPVTNQTLSDGDRIRIGDSALVFVHPAAEAVTGAVAVDDTPIPSSTIAIRPADSRYIASENRAAVDIDRTARGFAVLLRLSQAAQRVQTSDALIDLLLNEALQAVDADAAAMLTLTGTDRDIAVAATKGKSDGPVIVSRTVAARALGEQIAILANEMALDPRFHAADSVRGSTVRAALCAPLLTSGDPAAALYLSRSTSALFSEDDLHLVTGIGVIGGLAIDRVRRLEELENENRTLRRIGSVQHDLIGESPKLRAVLDFIARVASTHSTVLIRGESGTGKELVARALHASGSRARGPFVAINCAALPEHLLESELFGHERGAFTGAVVQQRGKLELADKGTVFLDEIGELAPPLQAKLLRVLQDRIVERLGGRCGIPIDVRVIAATNRDLERAIAAGAFRQDLFYRLNVVSVELPPLRDRQDDVLLLAAYFLRKHAARCKRVVRSISPAARKLLRTYHWPGNVRELENAIERAVVLGSSDVIEREDLPETLLECLEPPQEDAGYHAKVSAHKRAVIEEALASAGGNVAQAARALGLQPTYLHRLIRNLGVKERPHQ
jgi:Nif-specific regulatory protein